MPLVDFFCIPFPHDPFYCKIYTPNLVSTNISNVDERFLCSVDMLSTSPSRYCHPHHFSSYFSSLSSLLCNSTLTLLEKLLQYSTLLSNNSSLNNLLYSWVCREFINSVSEIIVISLESSSDEIFASNLSRRLTNTFSTILLSGKSSPNSQILFTIVKSLLKYSFMVSAFFILNISNSLLSLRTCISRVLSFP